MYCFKGSFTVFLTTLRPRKTCSRRSKSLDQQSVFTKHVASSYVNLLEQKKIFFFFLASTPTGPVCRVGTLFLTINSRTFEGHSRLHFPFFKDSIQCKNEPRVYVFFSSNITWVILSRGSFCVCSFLFRFLLKLYRIEIEGLSSTDCNFQGLSMPWTVILKLTQRISNKNTVTVEGVQHHWWEKVSIYTPKT